ncbi:hypothetical protein ACFL6P_06530 [Candidatus Latescibacterota bacterium]
MADTNAKAYYSKLIYTFLFAASFGYVEAMIVVYLREIYYPGGFTFPLVVIPVRTVILELCRETATIIMLAAVAVLTAKKFWERFGYFIISFGVWDIFYYIWLKAALDWPATLFDWDILFLIPLPWIGPVIAPVLISLLMIAVGVSITHLFHRGREFKPIFASWVLAVTATIILLYSFTSDLDAGLHGEMPEPYNYSILFVGLILYGAAYADSYRRVKKL